MAKKTLTARTKLIEGLRVETGSRNFSVIMDEPEPMGGSNMGMTPTEFLLNTLGSCLTISISLYSKAFHIDIEDLYVDIEGDIDSDGFLGKNKEVPIGFSDIRLHVHIKANAQEKKIIKLLDMAASKCPVSATLEGGVPIALHYNIESLIPESVE